MADPRIVQLLERGLRHFALGELDRAVDTWQQVVALEPQNERARDYLELASRAGVSEAAAVAPAHLAAAQEPAAAELLPWFEDAPAGTGADPNLRLDDWFDRNGPQNGGDLPPVAAGALPWQEWHSEAGLHATGELPWDAEAAASVASAPAAWDAAAEPPPLPALAPDAPGWAGHGNADPLLASPWSDVLPPEAGTADPWTAEGSALPEPMEAIGAEPWTPGPGSTGWDVADTGEAVLLADDVAGDALLMLDEEAPAPVAVPPALAGLATPGPSRRAEADTLMQGARELFDLGDFSGSLELVQKALSLQPDHRDARGYLERNQDTLVQMYESKLGSLESRPRVVLRPDEIVWLNLDHRAGFVLAQIDGTITIDDLYALSGLSRLDTAKILAELVEQGVICS
ncbi:hypothetical protein [Vulgatibacter sp.]|uniref:hypothetical protein n=1 Tax=Vulgatibacter sp. TaxID=1971226 RepID=UPI003564D496